MPATCWQLINHRWVLRNIDGVEIDSLTIDRDSGQYQNARGELVGARWEDARRRCEEAAARGTVRKAGA